MIKKEEEQQIKQEGGRHRQHSFDDSDQQPLRRCQILGKCEFLNPGGSVNDRVAVHIIQEALESDQLRPDGIVTEGSAGSTAISIATIAPAYGCRTHVVIPDDAAIEKSQILEALGATVERVRPVSITHKDHFVKSQEDGHLKQMSLH
ncbi:hypothetical protein GYH30_005657 [Glycine max]|nr:hypothetical protein GYH30_005657 [Glycine max]